MQRVFVLDKNKKPLMPCCIVRARELLTKGKAAVFRLFPFTVILKDRKEGAIQNVEVKIDPGSKTTGIALVGHFQKRKVIWAANLEHRGSTIQEALTKRRALRSSRRQRKTRFRPSRFTNRKRREGWIAPSLQSRVDNVKTWVSRLRKFVPISSIAVETVRFDTQKLQNPEISGVEYQQGELLGYEIREYLLEKWGRKCAYCGLDNTRLEIDHIIPKSKGGSNKISNLIICCRTCNIQKANRPIQDFLKDEKLLAKILAHAKTSLKDAAAVNTTRIAIGKELLSHQLPITFWSGGRTKYNRVQQNYAKDHWIDAACIGETGRFVEISKSFQPLKITAFGRGSRQYCLSDKYGFPRTSAKQKYHGFKTGNIVKAVVTKGKKQGTHIGRVSIRSSGYFCIDTRDGKVDGISHRYCKNMHSSDGYFYLINRQKERHFLLVLKDEVSMPSMR